MDNIFGFVSGLLGMPFNRPGESRQRRDDLPQDRPENEFRNPIWNMDDDDDDDDFREHVPNSPFGFQIFSNPLEIHRFFEHQMQEILKQFHMFGEDSVPALPPAPEGNRSLRDELLKPEYRLPDYHKNKVMDSDLDDRVSAGELDKILKEKPSLEQPSASAASPGIIRSFGSVSTKVIKQRDGRVERQETRRDGSGTEYTTITRQIGDKSYTVTTRVGPDGAKEQTESLVNLDESELSEFKKMWGSTQSTPTSDSNLWTKFFK